MRSKTIGSGTAGNNTGGAAADYTSIALWEASIADTDDETGTIITKVAATDTADVTLDAANTSRVYLLTADSSTYVNAPTYAAATTRARMNGNAGFSIALQTAGWILEKFSITAGGAGTGFQIGSGSASASIRRMVFQGMVTQVGVYSGSSTLTASNIAGLKLGNAGGANFMCGTSGSGGIINLYHSSWLGGTSGSGAISFGTIHAYACIGVGSGFGDFQAVSTFDGNYNVSSDTSAPGSASTKYLRSVTALDWLTNLTATTEDYAIPAGRQGYWAANKDAINQSGWPADVATDIVGTSRSSLIDPGVWQAPIAAVAESFECWITC